LVSVGWREAIVRRSIRVPRFWLGVSVSTRYLVLVAAIAAVGALAIGRWVSATIERAALEQHAGAAALYMGHFVALLDPGREGQPPSPEVRRALDSALATVGRRFGLAAIKVWSVDGRLVYASGTENEDRVQTVSGDVTEAAQGRIVVEFNAPSEESRFEFAKFDALVEVYAPVRDEAGDVAAVVEFYVQDRRLAALLDAARTETWAVTGGLLLLVLGGSLGLVLERSRSFARQRTELDSRITALSAEIDRRERLRERVEREARRTIEDNARLLKLIGSDLHDGPAQLISLALLRLDALAGASRSADVQTIRQALRESMAHIRNVSAGLLTEAAAGPVGLVKEIRRMAREHEAATGAPVALDLAEAPADCPRPVALCLRRVVQEGLANAARHAGGAGVRVRAARADGGIAVEVSDHGPGLAAAPAADGQPRLGLIGLRVRVESVGGALEVIDRGPGQGVTLAAWVPVAAG
jgi:signal transduction histidine kinase